jgi:hypothetical protein
LAASLPLQAKISQTEAVEMSRQDTDTLTLPAGAAPFGFEELARMPDRLPDRPRSLDEIEHDAESLRRAALVSGGRNPVFALMVENDDDIHGLVAYALYKQSKRDWMMEFATRNGREPTAEEIDTYILGERTPRRLATYKRLAGDALERFRAGGRTGERLMAAGQAQAAAQPGLPTLSTQPQSGSGFAANARLFAIALGVGVILTLVAIYAGPRLVGG